MTPENASQTLCPFARTFRASQPEGGCHGPSCALWRWVPVTIKHPAWLPAVRKAAAETGEKPPYPKAARFVADNKEVLGIAPTEGFCGAGGAL